MTNWISVCNVADIPVLGSRRVARAKGPQVALFRTADDRVHALLDRCPHKAGPLSQGIVFGNAVACPDEGRTPVFQVKVEDGVVLLDRDELDTVGIDLPAVKAGPCTRVAC